MICIYSLAFLHPIIAFTPMFSFSSKSQVSDATVPVTRTDNFPRVGQTYKLNANLCRKQKDILDLIFAEFCILFHCIVTTSNVAKSIFWFLRRILVKILVLLQFLPWSYLQTSEMPLPMSLSLCRMVWKYYSSGSLVNGFPVQNSIASKHILNKIQEKQSKARKTNYTAKDSRLDKKTMKEK